MSKFRTASAMIQEWEEASKRIQTESEIRADERRKFAEWLKSKYGLPKNYFGESITIDKLLSEYEKEQANE